MNATASLRRLACLVTAVAALFPFAACRKPAASPGSGVKIGFLVKQPEEPWFQLEWKFADKASRDLGFELVKIGVPDGEKTLAAIDNLAAGGAQGFIICTPDVRLGPAIVAKATQKGLKLLAVDDQFIGPDGAFMTNVHYLGISARKIGESVGGALHKEMTARGWPVGGVGCLVVTFDELDTAKQRTEGAVSALVAAGFPAGQVYRAPTRTPDIPGCFDAANVVLTKNPAFKYWLVCGMNDNAVLGAVRATEGRGFNAGNTIGIGINGTDCIVEFEKEKPTGFFASVLLTARVHGYDTAAMMHRWISEGIEPPLDTRTLGIMIDRTNFQQVLAEQGVRE